MAKLTKAAFIDALLDNWDSTGTKTYFSTITTGLDTAATSFVTPATPATPADIQTMISQLYLVFHYPQYDGKNLKNETKFDTLPTIDNNTVFNYAAGPPETKRLLSSTGISKPNMVILKMIIGELASADITTDASNMIKILLAETESMDINTNTTVLGGYNNNTLIPKTGGKGKNKSSKRVKKQPRRRNKSSKSLI